MCVGGCGQEAAQSGDEGRQERFEARPGEQKGLISTYGDRPVGASAAEPGGSAGGMGEHSGSC